MQGGNNAGIRTCWYNPYGLPKPENLRIDDEIRRIDQVPDLLERENGRCWKLEKPIKI